ncbi:YcjX family protein [Bartonella sp. HY329]|uniref:YcjX family protein n=1 Tax=unclassified Bartonella TaxID=2645622 RepID=UPI0021C926EC|nr:MULTISPECIES: YcjX family protein [unclassified Bartonella]UXM94006.1 YcjX family protein [Bartonella sp. HY329]UXN08328.1 YcjX family protein [Bartonella sp. HY328]
MASLTSFGDEARIALNTVSDRFSGLIHPTIRLGVTGLSTAGKTVFLTSLIQNLLKGGRLPLFKAMSQKRIIAVDIEHQPDDTLPRFEFEKHIDSLILKRQWPNSTRSLSQLRLTIKYQSRSMFSQYFSRGKLTVDIIDYPGEWLLDLPLLAKDYRTFSAESFERANKKLHKEFAKDWLGIAHHINSFEKADDGVIDNLSSVFKTYLKRAKQDKSAVSMLPPGRFLMPGDLDGSPALTFAPLPNLSDKAFETNSIAAIMERRYESYKKHVVRPFFLNHIARLDRQIILVDAMQAINSGAHAVEDLQDSLTEILACFRPGVNNWASQLISHKIDRIAIAATKADQLHHESHDRLEAIVRLLTSNALEKAKLNGVKTDSIALASLRTTREALAKTNGEDLPVIIGTPLKGEIIDGIVFDGETETAIFPGDLPKNPNDIIDASKKINMKFIHFSPPLIKATDPLPHIRLDRSLEFLLGDYLA